MFVKCSYCSNLIEGKHFENHLKYNHDVKSNVSYSCPNVECHRSFSSLHGLRRHSVVHANNNQWGNLDSADGRPICPNIEPRKEYHEVGYQPRDTLWTSDPSTNDVGFTDESQKLSTDALLSHAVNIVSVFYSDFTLPRMQVERIVRQFNDFLNSSWMMAFKNLTLKSLDIDSRRDFTERFDALQKVFAKVGTEHKRMKELLSRGYYVEPETITFGYAELRNSKGLLENKSLTGQFIPLRAILKVFFEIPKVFSETIAHMSELLAEKSTTISNIVQTAFWKNKLSGTCNLLSLLDKNQVVLPLFLYEDDFETGNPLGSHATVYKISGVYITIPSLPPKYLSKLDNIFLLQLHQAEDSKTFPKQRIYARIVQELNHLATNGVEINIGHKTYTIFFKLTMIIGDNLGLNSTLGYVQSFRANYFCRFCKITKSDSMKQCFEESNILRDIRTYKADILKNDVRTTGIREESSWNCVKDFHVTENYCVDIMHDLLEGVCAYDMAYILEDLVCRQKLLSLESLNFKIQYYNYPPGINQPPLISLDNLKKRHLKMSAAEMMCFILHAGLIFGDLIPEGNKHWELHKLIRQILSLTLKSSVCDDLCDLLCTLVEEHHLLFTELFGNCLKPKHHNMLHYARIMKIIGPLRHIWAMRFEAKHRPFKQNAKVTCNRINLCLTLAKKNQLHLSHVLLSHSVFNDCIVIQSGNEELAIPITVNLSDPVISDKYTQIKYFIDNNVKYQIDTVLVIRYDELPVFGIITNILCKKSQDMPLQKNDLAAIVRVFENIGQNEHLQAYQVEDTESFEFIEWNCIPEYELKNMQLSNGDAYVPC